MTEQLSYPYVYWHTPTQRWFARLLYKGHLVHLGFFEEHKDAQKAVDMFCKEFGLAESGVELRELRARRGRMTRLEKLRQEHKATENRVDSIFKEENE